MRLPLAKRLRFMVLCLLYACFMLACYRARIARNAELETDKQKGFCFLCAGIFRSNRYADDENKQRTVYNCCPSMAASPAGSNGQPDAVL